MAHGDKRIVHASICQLRKVSDLSGALLEDLRTIHFLPVSECNYYL